MSIPLTRFRNLPVRRKLHLAILLTCSTVLVLACAVLFIFQAITIRQNLARDLVTLSRIISHTSAAAVVFKDREIGLQALSALAAKPDIEQAYLILEDGERLVEFEAPQYDHHDISHLNVSDGYVFHGDYIIVSSPVNHDGRRVGTLNLVANFDRAFYDLMQLYAGILALVLVLSLVLAVLLSRQLQPFITGPILKLTGIAQRITEGRDYSMRAEKVGNDEVGFLTDAFNEMVEQMQSHDELKHEIAERKRSEAALRESEQRFRSVAESANDGIIIADADLRILSWNNAARLMFGVQEDLEANASLPELFIDCCKQGVMSELVGKSNELTGRRYDRTEFPLELSLSTWKTDSGTFFSGVIRDLSERKQAEEALRESQQRLVETSRYAGMAEVATGVLHNVGNVLNSVNVSASVICDKVRGSIGVQLVKVADAFRDNAATIGDYITTDPRGRLLPGIISKIATALQNERSMLSSELERLSKNVSHIKEIVAMQQSYARTSGVIETLPVTSLVEDALEMNAAGLLRHSVEVVREFEPVPNLLVDKHRAMQILVNLIRNAKQAVQQCSQEKRKIIVCVRNGEEGDVKIEVRDFGVGIAPENLTRIFSHGFTTKKGGHGFGLHSSALSAAEMGGKLTALSEGLGTGAVFTLALPLVGKS